ncbi:Uncharacterised protein [Enterobacter hormaechei]|nr:Uncharacterised protein [Enterobacter hormaechei]
MVAVVDVAVQMATAGAVLKMACSLVCAVIFSCWARLVMQQER